MPGRVYLELLNLAQEQHGYLTPEDAREIGVNPTYLRVLASRRVLEHPARGVFRFPTNVIPETPLDELAAAVAWPQDVTGTLSHEMALDLYEICDINPDRIHFTVPSTYRIRREVPALYVVHRADLARDDLARRDGLPITAVRRTIADCIAARVRGGLIEQAIETARKQTLLTKAHAEELHEMQRRRHTGTA